MGIKAALGNCLNKKRYPTQEKALRAVRPNIKLGSYRCNLCGGWHLTRKFK